MAVDACKPQDCLTKIFVSLGMHNQYTHYSSVGVLEAYERNTHNYVIPQQPLKLSIISQFFPPDYAATGQLLAELAIQLQRLGIEVKVFTGQPGYAFDKGSAPRKEVFQGVKIRRSSATRLWSRRIRGRVLNGLIFCFRAGIHLLKSVNRGEVLLVTTEPPYLPILGYIAHLCFGLPYICLIYDLYPDVAVKLQVVSEHHWLVWLWNWLNCQVWKYAQGIIVLSSTMKEQVAAKCPDIADKITVIPSWSNPEWIKPLDKNHNWFAQQFNLVDKFTVLYSGNMGRCHDIDTILTAAKELKDEPIQFIFIGNGAKRRACIEKITALSLDNCRFLPYQDKSFLPYSLTACDLSLVSIDQGMEGLVAPSKLYGILAAGRSVAVICEPHSYLRQLVNDACCGQAFDNGDGHGLAKFIRHLANNDEIAHSQGLAGRKYLQSRFTPEVVAQKYSQVLHHARLKS